MKTKYSIVREYIEKKITDGTYQPNQKIESESELMKRFGISRHTVRLAVGDLVTEGWLYREQGSGTFCKVQSQNKISNTKSVKKIAIITTYISDYIFPSIIRGAESRLSEKGYQVSIFSTNNCYEKEQEILEKVLVQNFDGLIVEPTKSACSNPNITYYLELERLKIPYIMINAYYDALEPIHITVNDEKGGFMQTEHLIKNGHEHIVGLLKTDDVQGVKRLKGFLKAHRRYDIEVRPSNIITYETEQKTTKPAEELKKILDHDNQITAIACYNDELAMGLLDVLRKKEFRVPEDISIIGYDDSFLAEMSEVKLTSIKHPKNIMGVEAADKIMELILYGTQGKSNKGKRIESVIHTPEIKIRNSVNMINRENRKEA